MQILWDTTEDSCEIRFVFDAFMSRTMEDENDYSYVIQSGIYFITMQNTTFEGTGALVHYADD